MSGTDTVKAASRDSFVRGFRTSDLDFTAFLLSQNGAEGRPSAELLKVEGSLRQTASPVRSYKYTFVLCSTPTGDDDNRTFTNLQRLYTSRLCSVEPISFLAQRKQLRAMMNRNFDGNQQP